MYKLRKSLYGLKQSGRNWNNMLHEYLLGENFTQSLADPCVYTRYSSTNECTIIIGFMTLSYLLAMKSYYKCKEFFEWKIRNERSRSVVMVLRN